MKHLHLLPFLMIFSQLIFASSHISIQSGSWYDTATWNTNSIPADFSNVVISPATEVVVPDSMAEDRQYFTGVQRNYFSHNGTIMIMEGAMLKINSNYYLKSKNEIFGALMVEKGILVVQDTLFINPNATVYVEEGTIIREKSIINVENTTDLGQCLTIDGLNAKLSGDGTILLGGDLKTINGADSYIQISHSLTIRCKNKFCNFGEEFRNPNFQTLPVTIAYFSATISNQEVFIEWETLSEQNNDYFVVERSGDLKNWQVINQVDGFGNSTAPINYEVMDKNPLTGTSYYRLSQVDVDGKKTIYSPEAVQLDFIQKATLFPNPASDHFFIDSSEEIISVMLLTPQGQTKALNTNLTFEGLRCDLNMELENNIYHVVIETAKGREVKKLKIN